MKQDGQRKLNSWQLQHMSQMIPLGTSAVGMAKDILNWGKCQTFMALHQLLDVHYHWKTPWPCERLKSGGEGDDRGRDSWMASSTQWRWVWVNSRSWWWSGRPGVLQSMGSQRVGHDWVTELNWTRERGRILRWISLFSQGQFPKSDSAKSCQPQVSPEWIP